MDKPRELVATSDIELLPFLLEQHPSKGRNKVKALLTRGQVMVGEEVVTKHNHPLRAGDRITILSTGSITGRDIGAGSSIVYEDEQIIIMNKPPGLLSIATEEEKEHTAFRIMTDHVKKEDRSARLFIVHRLDKETSGLMMFAKSEEVKRKLQDNWKDIILERAYIALVEGSVEKEAGTIKTWLKESATKTMYVSRQGDGVLAVTHYKVIQKSPEFSLLSVQLETGRKNQIRVHMQSIGHSVVGDRRYGSRNNPIGRLGLHAYLLSFNHPVTGKTMKFETRVPGKFRSVFAQKGSQTKR